MPPSGRKAKTRARRAPAATEAHEPSDVDVVEAQATPTRGSKKRTRGSETTAPVPRNTRRKTKDTRPAEGDDTEGTEAHEASDNETEPSTPTEQEIIQSLRVSDKQVMAVEDYANDLLEGQENVPGYGKIAGRDWVFIIRKVEVNIGRPEAHERLPVASTTEGGVSQPTTPTARTIVDIDLGPDRQISRLHATISYEPDEQRWIIRVNGRNGVRVDNNLCRRGGSMYLRNGSVIEIASTQMAFITTATDENDGPVWDASIIKQAQSSSDDGHDGEDDPRNGHARTQASSTAGRGHQQEQSVYQSDFSGQQQRQGSQQQQQRMHPHSQRAALQANPGTPLRATHPYAKSSPAANYARGVMMESTETIDYAAESAKDLKPPHSYAQLIGMAILSTQEQQMTLNNIYKWIMANYAFYRFNTGGWQNSIRHNLSLNKAFTKIARRTDEPGKGMKWIIEPTEFDNFVQQGMKGCRRPNPIPGTQSTLGSPHSPALRSGIKRDDEITPPMNSYQPSYSTAIEAYTPDRGPRRPANGRLESSAGLAIESHSLVDYDYPQRSTPRNGLNALANAAGSPPALYVNDEGRTGPLDTPFPLRPSQRLAPPSTLRRPSDFIQFSSPAPFWKMEGLAGSTPFKPFDISPLKTPFPLNKEAAKQSQEIEERTSPDDKPEVEELASKPVEPKRAGSPLIGSSSPPRAHNPARALDASPTISRPTTAVAKTLSQLGTSSHETDDERQHAPEKTPPSAVSQTTAVQQHTPPTTVVQTTQPAARQHELPKTAVVNSFEPVQPPATNGSSYRQSGPYAPVSQPHTYQANDDDDEGIDLAKGFQPIGTFHQQNHMAMHAGMPTFR
ncbi:Putative forkhead-associated (FHA) domain, Fork head domain, SMAD/FHA domain superfamily [Septoria linicola]|uniref:Forkhead-associated (FHA) domain, Fork head domain, SMAD/FHA domain superfamily n=1 Tax=Septoria linicola TaxID=215465 RepID=A0A9Q9AK06_9PEZI|nr:putative forkhead-associated (FHA) domain, Fork head domain, SMAD/FHA domain superfamily [Septoria linicola]USW47563.1 Putative forkhead-associated (FHA) domain, Fork head domain, SMAD/FHA domain superfamily [Septoria linicola]